MLAYAPPIQAPFATLFVCIIIGTILVTAGIISAVANRVVERRQSSKN